MSLFRINTPHTHTIHTLHDSIAYSFQTPEKGKPNAAVILKVRILDKTRFIIVLETFAFFLEEKKKVTSVFTPLWYVCMYACMCVCGRPHDRTGKRNALKISPFTPY